ncbi:hypothetical protein BXT86_04655 [candidate division WOR-3 bacterium 4484_100]|uniref:Uncharacterized protein n=1 Tax=candidate division WOR-3 bacterium 4484_100 TaxID=1936077 RepID=A0A1V4QG01_UNCW3|nr:MAG: hypothetical protein BXT86_04655 [candidate division WOR-3 bacterium 4484_100]
MRIDFCRTINSLEKKSLSIKEIGILIFSFIIIRNILEGILERGHLLGLHPYPYRSILINFVHFPLFYTAIFMSLLVILYSLTDAGDENRVHKFYRIATILAKLFGIILIPPLVDFIVSTGEGYRLTYIIQTPEIFDFILSSLNPFDSTPGVSVGMKCEIYLALILIFIYLIIKCKNVLISGLGVVITYFTLLFLGFLPLLVARIFGLGFSEFYSNGGILYFDTQKFAGIFFIFCIILVSISGFIFFPEKFKRIYRTELFNLMLLLFLVVGFLYGLRLFLNVKPDFLEPPDYLSLPILLIAGFMGLRIGPERYRFYTVVIGLVGIFIISYYAFICFLGAVLAIELGRRYGGAFRVFGGICAVFFAFLSGFSVFTAERAFPALISTPMPRGLRLKSSWSETEIKLIEIENSLTNKEWSKINAIFKTRPHLLSPSRMVYLEGISRMRQRQMGEAQLLIKGAIRLGYRSLDGYLTLAGLYYQTHRFGQALEIYKGLFENGEQDTRVYKGLAGTYFQLQNYRRSIYFYKKVIEQGDMSPSIYNNLGVAYLKLGDYAQARNNFLKALSLEPQFLEAKKNLQLIP